jgi:CRISPR-associated protein (TIGR03986 family)
MIRAPFNFVPLNKHVFFPEDTNLVSQDVPFSDGKSGTITIKITAESPMFVSDKHNNGQTEYFCHIPAENQSDWKYYIPGTSIKGAVRNVLEILSFGKMTQVQNRSFTIRDLYRGKKNDDDESTMTDGDFYMNKLNAGTIHCGWMTMQSDGYYIDDCGEPWRISMEKIDKMFEDLDINLDMDDFVKGENFTNSPQNKGNRFAKAKYDKLLAASGRNSYAELDSLLKSNFINDNDTAIERGNRIFKCYGTGGAPGTIVFTGQPGTRKIIYNKETGKEEWTGKYFEFIFPDEILRKAVRVPDGVFKSFESIHRDSPDYGNAHQEGFRYKELRKGRPIPVFFTYKTTNANEIDSIGITYMYRYPAFNSVYNGITPIELLDIERPDLPECIFGYTTRKDSLKGRVSFSHAFLQSIPHVLNINYALSSPHPSFYPLYLGNGQSWNSQSIRIAGRKRYPVRNRIESNKGSEGMNKPIRPLATGSEFRGQINFFNLRPFELGALLSSLDFCGRNECHHSLGQGKPLGYGKCKIVIENVSFSSPIENHVDTTTFREVFEDMMNNESVKKNWPEKWEDSVQLRELFAMARGIPNGQDDYFTYMKLRSKDEEDPTFEKAKKAYKDNNEQLGRFSQIIINPDKMHTYSVTQDIASLQEERLDIESYLLCKERFSEIVDTGILPDDITPEELVWMEGVLCQFQDENGGDNSLLSIFADLIAPKKLELEERLAKEKVEAKARMAEKEKEELARVAQEKEEALKQKEAERLARNKAKNAWKQKQKEENEKEVTNAIIPSAVTETVLSFTEQLALAPSVGQLTKMIEKHYKDNGKNNLSDEELHALTKGILNVISTLKEKMSRKDLIQKGAWSPDGSIWKKVVDLVGCEPFVSAFPVFDDDKQ